LKPLLGKRGWGVVNLQGNPCIIAAPYQGALNLCAKEKDN